ncbi:alpha/beta hydrolase [Apibacter sp. HY039]|uniref:alpha/beta hydrolase n=1 Tax=Apibacter sp. HY039 TaxID=2501476 RepID=UPI000FEB6210|nr:alpha/beta hydrolase-fold protein [Apibacter sp. HY039]
MKAFVIFICFLSSFGLNAQESIIIGEKYKIYSQILNEEREFWVYTPPEYKKGSSEYPVIYLIDGETNFHSLVAIQKAFTKGMYNYMPESIIIGIVNTDRTRDLTPSKSFLKRDEKVFFENSGGAVNFHNFLIKELRPYINTQYRTNGYNTLIGHSFGGLFTLYTLIHNPVSFNSYIALDPSIWWDNRKIFNEALKMEKGINYKGINVFIAKAKDEGKDKSEHSESIQMFCDEVIDSLYKSNGLRSKWKYYAEEDHGTVILPGMYDALKFNFQGITLPVKKIPENPELIKITYDHLSEQLGYKFIPSETLINNLAEYALSVKEFEGAQKILDYNLLNKKQSDKTKEIELIIRNNR